MYNLLNIAGNSLIYIGLLGLGYGLGISYISSKYNIYEKASKICLDCSNNINKFDDGENNDSENSDVE